MPSLDPQRERDVFKFVESGELEVDLEGRVWRLSKRVGVGPGVTRVIPIERRRTETPTRKGYLQVRVAEGNKRFCSSAHRLVWHCFKGPIPKEMTINHKNGIKHDNRLDNLELANRSEQQVHANKVLGTGSGANQFGENGAVSKLLLSQVEEIKSLCVSGIRQKVVAKQFGISQQHVSQLVRGVRWNSEDSKLIARESVS